MSGFMPMFIVMLLAIVLLNFYAYVGVPVEFAAVGGLVTPIAAMWVVELLVVEYQKRATQ